MTLRRLTRVAAACATLGATVGIAALAGGTAGASYGPGTQYQVEVSANASSLAGVGGATNGSGGGFWFWAALTPPPPGETQGTVDYQESDCVHNFPLASTGDVNNGGATYYTDSGGMLTIYNVMTGLGPLDISVPDVDGHYGTVTFGPNGDPAAALLNLALTNVQVQVAP